MLFAFAPLKEINNKKKFILDELEFLFITATAIGEWVGWNTQANNA